MKNKLFLSVIFCLSSFIANATITMSGTLSVCFNATTTLTAAGGSGGGTWTSGNTTVASVSSSGVVTGLSGGTSSITYSEGVSNFDTKVVTVNPLQPIMGSTVACVGGTGATHLSNTSANPSSWSSDNTSIATINGSGVVTGISAGTTTITFHQTTGCYAIITFTVNPLPATISGTPSVCPGLTTALSDADAGGTWTSTATAAATIGTSGIVTGVATGTTNISYTLPTGCKTGLQLTVSPLPAPITGATAICVNSPTTLSDGTSGGTWASSTTSVATISSGGVVTGTTTGTTTITYTRSNGCYSTANVTVNTAVPAITGTTAVCSSLGTTVITTALHDATGGGLWSNSSSPSGTINASTGIFTSGTTTGTVIVTYTLSAGCKAIATMTVNQTPGSIIPPANLYGHIACVGLTYSFTDTTSGGLWSSSNTSVATIDPATGIATGIAIGGTNISYSLSTGCYATIILADSVDAPLLYNGDSVLCVGGFIQVNDATSRPGYGGVLTSSDPSIAAVQFPTHWPILGVSVGTATITYTHDATGCIATLTVTVQQLVANITGTTNICVGSTSVLSDATVNGRWYSANPAVATVVKTSSTTGLLTGVAAGTALISYVVANSLDSCYNTVVVTVGPIPDAGTITGTPSVCFGATTDLSDAVTGGVWSSSDNAVATVGSTGVVTGVTDGTVVISYTVSSSCSTAVATKIVTVSTCCYVNTITINTGYAPGTNSRIPGMSADGSAPVPDSTWLVTAFSHASDSTITASGYTKVAINGRADVISDTLPHYGNAWAHSPTSNSNWITGQNSHGYYTDGTGPAGTLYTMTLTRPFTTVVADSLIIDFHTATDNYIDSANIDDSVFLFHQPSTDMGHYGSFSESDHFVKTIYLGAGCHKMNFLVVNYNLPDTAYNPTGLNLYGTITSATSANSIVREDEKACNSLRCMVARPAQPTEQGADGIDDFILFPNPNNGTLTLSGTLPVGNIATEAKIEIIDLLGRSVYTNTAVVNHRKISTQIRLDNHIAEGVYLVRIKTSSSSNVIRFTLKR